MMVVMQILILAVGKESSLATADIQHEYERRLKSHAAITWKLLPAARSIEPPLAKEQESSMILSQLKPTDTVLLLDERGIEQSNEEFAKTFEHLAGTHGRLVCVIGGAFGVTDAVRSRASFVWSLSKLVFPHQIVRVMLLEQLYRTYMVLNNHPYHHS